VELIFLGTSAGVPTRSRNVTAILLNLQHPTQAGLWLFDCGEGTQHQLLRTPFPASWIVFLSPTCMVTTFLACPAALQPFNGGQCQPLTIYGPKGIREFVETSLRLSGSWTDYPLTIEEVSEGLVVDDGLRRVTAFALNHPVECYGYRIEEHDKPGALDAQA
jgi:ribonuclease Z